jgi:hypothetical protein
MSEKPDLTKCPKCGGEKWTWIPDSLAQYCACGFVRIADGSGHDGTYSEGTSLREWAADLYKISKGDKPE